MEVDATYFKLLYWNSDGDHKKTKYERRKIIKAKKSQKKSPINKKGKKWKQNEKNMKTISEVNWLRLFKDAVSSARVYTDRLHYYHIEWHAIR